jgi:hypothetical protein
LADSPFATSFNWWPEAGTISMSKPASAGLPGRSLDVPLVARGAFQAVLDSVSSMMFLLVGDKVVAEGRPVVLYVPIDVQIDLVKHVTGHG